MSTTRANISAGVVNETLATLESSQPNIFKRMCSLFLAMRPRQWIKNFLIFAAPFAAGQIIHVPVLKNVLIAFVSFSIASSAVYLINDIKDINGDRAHPTKRYRPIAAGRVPLPLAAITAVVLLIGALGLAFTANRDLVLVIAVYEAIQLGYCFGLKNQPVIELCIVASGFLMRAIAGGVATSIALSQWFLLVAAFGSLFMAAGKRYGEIHLVERTGIDTRKSLKFYSASYLQFMWATAAAIVIMTYSLWAFEIHGTSSSVWSIISIVPFVIAIFRYAVDVDNGKAGDPEEVTLKDRTLQLLCLIWIGTLVAAFYV